MGVLVAIFALLFSMVAAAKDLGPYQITSGDIQGADSGVVSGKGFTGGLFAGPEGLSYPLVDDFFGGTPRLSFCFGCGLPGTDDGVGVLTAARLSNPALRGLVQVSRGEGPIESGELTVSPTIDVTGAGTYSAPFTLFARLAYGAPNTTVPEQYVDFVGVGTVSITYAARSCGVLSCPLRYENSDYVFKHVHGTVAAPELAPSEVAALMLLYGATAVIRRRRAMRQ